MTYDPRILDFAAALAVDMEKAERNDGTTFHRVKTDRQHVWQDVVREAHGADMMPDDYRYAWIADAAEMMDYLDPRNMDALDDFAHEAADSLTSVYTHELTAWVASHNLRPGIVDEAAEEIGLDDAAAFDQRLMCGQYHEIRGVVDRLIRALDEHADDLAEALGMEPDAEFIEGDHDDRTDDEIVDHALRVEGAVE